MPSIQVDTLSRGTNFPAELVNDLISKVRGHSSIAKLSDQRPLAFNGNQYMVFNMPNGIDVVAENGKKGHGGATVESKTIVPIKFEYGARVSDEFLYAAEEVQLDMLREFTDGFGKLAGKGLDIAAFHGVNPRTGKESAVIGDNNFDSQVAQTVTYDATKANENLQEAVEKVQEKDGDITGMALSPAFGSAMGSLKDGSGYLYPQFQFGQTPDNFAGYTVDVNKTVSTDGKDEAIIGDFANAYRWGYARDINVEVIEYGDPDNSGVDLKGSNQVYIRAEIYLGWAILDPTAFARIVTE